MKSLKIYIDNNYPKKLVEALQLIHKLQTEKTFELISWESGKLESDELNDAIFLLVNFQKKGIEIPIQKHYEDGCRVVVCKTAGEDKLDFFEFSMTVLRVWPFIIEKATAVKEPFLYSFKYGKRKLTRVA